MSYPVLWWLNKNDSWSILKYQPTRARASLIKRINSTADNLRKSKGDFNELVNHKSWKKTIENLQDKCVGLNQKAFWIARVMKQKGEWDIPGRFCCVSDSHNKAFLTNTGFIKSDQNLFFNSKIMWEYFNRPFKNKYYDLPIFRFAKEHECKQCHYTKCNLKMIKQCYKRGLTLIK